MVFMKKRGILHAQLAGYVAGLGHKDLFLVADAGMPIPRGVPIVDLAVCGGVPTFLQVLDALLEEVAVERYVLAEEIATQNPGLLSAIQERLAGIEAERISHEALKARSAQGKFAVRTGEFTPYPNVILQAGVVFS